MSTKHEHQGIITATLADSAEVHTGSAVSTALQADHRAASRDLPAVETALPGRMPHLLAAHQAEAGLWRIDILKFMGDLDGLVASGRIDRDTHNVVLWKLKGASS
jgi:hypothetical protein